MPNLNVLLPRNEIGHFARRFCAKLVSQCLGANGFVYCNLERFVVEHAARVGRPCALNRHNTTGSTTIVCSVNHCFYLPLDYLCKL
jgi:hypothetical protein